MNITAITVPEMFALYFKACYHGKSVSAIQRKEVEQAFNAGALTMFEVMTELSALPEDEAFKRMDALRKDCVGFALNLKLAQQPKNQ